MQMTQPKIQGLKFKSGINLYAGEQAGQFLFGTMRSRLAISSPLAPEIYSALKRGITHSELDALLAISAADLDELLAQLHSYVRTSSEYLALYNYIVSVGEFPAA